MLVTRVRDAELAQPGDDGRLPDRSRSLSGKAAQRRQQVEPRAAQVVFGDGDQVSASRAVRSASITSMLVAAPARKLTLMMLHDLLRLVGRRPARWRDRARRSRPPRAPRAPPNRARVSAAGQRRRAAPSTRRLALQLQCPRADRCRRSARSPAAATASCSAGRKNCDGIGRRRLEDGVERRPPVLRAVAQDALGRLLAAPANSFRSVRNSRSAAPRCRVRRQLERRLVRPRRPGRRRRAARRALPARDRAPARAASTSPSSIDNCCCARSAFSRLPAPCCSSSVARSKCAFATSRAASSTSTTRRARDDRQVRVGGRERDLPARVGGAQLRRRSWRPRPARAAPSAAAATIGMSAVSDAVT